MAGAGLPQNNAGQQMSPQGKGPAASTYGQPTYQPIGINNPPASYNPVAPVPGNQPANFGLGAKGPAQSPYQMNNISDGNSMQNQNSQSYSPMLPVNNVAQPQQWYPGMYPTNQPQFGTSAYSPQTFNMQGHPGDGHNPLGTGATMPNQTMSNQGQMTTQMAVGGLTSIRI